MTPNNAIAGFRATRIYPCDPLKYPVDRYGKLIMVKFDDWVNVRRPAARSEVSDKELPVIETSIDFAIDEQLPSTSKQADHELASTSKQTIPLLSTTISTPYMINGN